MRCLTVVPRAATIVGRWVGRTLGALSRDYEQWGESPRPVKRVDPVPGRPENEPYGVAVFIQQPFKAIPPTQGAVDDDRVAVDAISHQPVESASPQGSMMTRGAGACGRHSEAGPQPISQWSPSEEAEQHSGGSKIAACLRSVVTAGFGAWGPPHLSLSQTAP